MLGRTHLAIGALGAATLVPLIVKGGGITQLATVHHLEDVAICIAGSGIGALLVDLDQKDSLAARRVERVGQAVIFLTLFFLITSLHVTGILLGLSLIGSLIVSLACRREFARKIALTIVALACIFLSVTGHMAWIAGVLFAIWAVGAMMTAHRTFTHSLLGLIIISVAALNAQFPLEKMTAWFIILGYALHMVADILAGGVPLLWPIIKERQGVRVVKTGSGLDKFIGGIATLAFVLVLVGVK